MMNIPVQPDEIRGGNEAFAPYNFVRLPEQVVTVNVKDLPDQGIYNVDPNIHSGYIECILTTASPIYIRAGINTEQFNNGKESKDNPSFFHLDNANNPVIPGSSLRGMLRTLLEIITYSKVSEVSKKPLVYRAVGDTTSHGDEYRKLMVSSDGKLPEIVKGTTKTAPHFTPQIKGGYMVQVGKNDWAIRPAKVVDGVTYAHIINKDLGGVYEKLEMLKDCRAARKVFVKVDRYEYKPVKEGALFVKHAKVLLASASADSVKDGYMPATLLRSGDIDKKNSEVVIYDPDDTATLLRLKDETVDTYRDQLKHSQEQINLLGEDGVLQNGHPVFYILDREKKEVFFFGHARMFRVPYLKSPFDYIPKNIKEIEDINFIDIAEAIFGFTKDKGEGRQRAYAGRVSVSDAKLVPEQKDYWLSKEKEPVNLKILSGPKTTTFQHYLVQDMEYRTKAGTTKDGKPRYAYPRHDYSAKTPNETVIRGHKFYWHKGEATLNDIKEDEQVKENDTQHTKIHPIRENIKFKFRIWFENLNEIELGSLYWILYKAREEQYRLKIGMGKPLGMGAIKLDSDLFIQETGNKYEKLIEFDKWVSGFVKNEDIPSKALSAFLVFMEGKIHKKLDDADRILALLKLLEWPGPDPDITRYMSIQKKEYKNRPILPSPFGVWASQGADNLGKDTVNVAFISQTQPSTNDLITGVVKWYSQGNYGYHGYIKPDVGSDDIHVDEKNLRNKEVKLKSGQKVKFSIQFNKKGKPCAENVEIIQ